MPNFKNCQQESSHIRLRSQIPSLARGLLLESSHSKFPLIQKAQYVYD